MLPIQKNQKKSPSGKKKIFLVQNPFVIILDVFVVFLLIAIGIIGYVYYKTPLPANLSSSDFSQTTIIYDRTGQHSLYEIHGEENRKVISHDEIPNVVRQATIAAEDKDFYNHEGIDLEAMIRALKADLQNNELQQGASTITQQLARNIFLDRQKNFRRKFLEIILALKIERNYTKDQILDMYLNQVPYGSNAYGIQSAALTFFGKNAKELTLDEAAILAALPNAPTLYSPYGNNQNDLINRRNYILERMNEMNMIKLSQLLEAKNTKTLTKIIPFKQAIEAPHFVFYVKEHLEKQYGKDMVERGGFKVYTTLDYNLQKKAEQIVAQRVAENKIKYNSSNASLVAIDPRTGEILAMVGSRDYFDKSIDGQVNVAIRPRQPGSSFKPFAYAAAFEKGYQPENLVYDIPTNFGPDGSGQDYTPQNYNGRFNGLVSMRQALAMSLNIPAVKTLYLAGINDTIDLAHRLGINTLNQPQRYGLALVLGGGEVTLLDETSAFSVFANDGKRNPAIPILKIMDSHGKVFYSSSPSNTQVIHPEIARKINSILSDNSARSAIFGSNNKLVIPGKTVAAKTGTTQDFHDAWTVGYSPNLAVGVWTGNNDNSTMKEGADGSYVAAPIWNDFMSYALNNYSNTPFTPYDESAAKNLIDSSYAPVYKYFNNKTGKEISQEKARKTKPEKVSVRMEFPSGYWTPSGISLIVEMTNTSDPMIQRWRSSLGSSFSYQDMNYSNN